MYVLHIKDLHHIQGIEKETKYIFDGEKGFNEFRQRDELTKGGETKREIHNKSFDNHYIKYNCWSNAGR